MKPTILIVDDEDNLRTLLRHHFETDYEVIEAKNGKEGLDKILSDSPAYVISDMKMPLMDGAEMISSARAQGYQGPITVISGYAEPDRVEMVKSLDVDYRTKPMDFRNLKSYVNRKILKDKPDIVPGYDFDW